MRAVKRGRRNWAAVVGLLAVAGGALLAHGRSDQSPPAAGDRPQDLANAVVGAAEAVSRHQQPDGYWLTPVTVGPIFEQPKPEVNVFVPAIIVDLLEPVAAETGLRDVLERAREHLRRQIEPSGLVRYHGAPPRIDDAQRGCELPPDADDTALVWRIAAPDAPDLLLRARRGLEPYRNGDGLYLTWLADQDAYRCFYSTFFPKNPNPPDVAIQMHLYLFFARYDPDAGRALCDALRARIAEDRIWVWYTVAPLLPLLREIDLAQAGCAVTVPARRFAGAAPGQDRYLAAARLLRDLMLDPGAANRDAVLPVLRGLAAHDFADVAAAPPLLYHNALSATPPHYHWSEDIGYALWLRLYVESARRWPGSLPLPARPVKAS